MNTLLEFLQPILPAIITAIVSFLIAKYTYGRNIPLDKMEHAYNRVYYPIYRILNNKSINPDIIINECRNYFVKYNKYVDRSTQKAFDYLCKSNTDKKKMVAFSNFKNNIYSRNSYLRRRLGYLEPSILQIYTYSSNTEKSTLRIIMELFFVYIAIAVGGISGKGKILDICVYCVILLFVMIIIELVCRAFMFLYYKFSK